jgi:hypothetical protein
LLEIRGFQDNRGTVGVWLTRHLAQNPVASTDIGQHYSRAEFGL